MNTLTENTVQALGWMLVHFLWQGLVVAVIFALARGLLRDARHRYAAGCLAMLALVAMPALTLLTSDFETGSVSAGPDLSGGTMVANSSMSTIDAESLRPAALSPAVLSPAALAEGWTLPVRHAVRQAMPAIVLCWLAGVLFLSLRLVGGGWICWRLKRRGVGPFPEGFRLRALNLAKCMNVRQRVRMLTSSIADVPMVIGVFRPAILLPASMLLGLAPDQLEAILVHELAHIRRHDNLVNLVQRLLETVFFFHPAAWWVSACIRTEREHCCDDIAAAASDARAYAGALTTLEELRSPALAVAATDGSLSSRVRRVLGFRQSESRQGWMGPAIASAMVMAAVTVLVPDAYVSASPSNTTEGDKPMNVTVDVAPTKPHAGTTLAASLSPLMRTAGESGWTMARLQGVMGHAFQFKMIKGGGGVMHDNLDWGHAVRIIPELGQFRAFDANKNNPVDDLPSYKRDARDAVLGSLQRGVPVLAWQPMSLEQKNSEHPASHAYCWGLIVGYNDAEETYTIRHPFVSVDYTVRYDDLGPADPGGWFGLRIWEKPTTNDPRELHLTALHNALGFAHGTLFTDENFVRPDGKQANPYGFAAYETWSEAFESDEVPLAPGSHHADMLVDRRTAAAAYMRELVEIFPEAAQVLETAATHYDREVGVVVGLRYIIRAGREAGEISDDQRAEVRQLLSGASRRSGRSGTDRGGAEDYRWVKLLAGVAPWAAAASSSMWSSTTPGEDLTWAPGPITYCPSGGAVHRAPATT